MEKKQSASPSYIYSTIATALVLIVLGIALFSFWKAYSFSNELKENLMMEVVLKDDIAKDKIDSLKIAIEGQSYCKSIQYVSKEEAAALLRKELNENFEEILGYNPLYNSYQLYLKNDFASAQKMAAIEGDLLKISYVAQVNYQKNIVSEIDILIKDISLIVIGVVVFLLIFAVSLIFSTTKLFVFTNKDTIKTMQLFGATRFFIIKPFLIKSIINGVIAGLLAAIFIFAIGYYINTVFPSFNLQNDLSSFGVIAFSVLMFGIIISFFSTLLASIKYLNYKL